MTISTVDDLQAVEPGTTVTVQEQVWERVPEGLRRSGSTVPVDYFTGYIRDGHVSIGGTAPPQTDRNHEMVGTTVNPEVARNLPVGSIIGYHTYSDQPAYQYRKEAENRWIGVSGGNRASDTDFGRTLYRVVSVPASVTEEGPWYFTLDGGLGAGGYWCWTAGQEVQVFPDVRWRSGSQDLDSATCQVFTVGPPGSHNGWNIGDSQEVPGMEAYNGRSGYWVYARHIREEIRRAMAEREAHNTFTPGGRFRDRAHFDAMPIGGKVAVEQHYYDQMNADGTGTGIWERTGPDEWRHCIARGSTTTHRDGFPANPSSLIIVSVPQQTTRRGVTGTNVGDDLTEQAHFQAVPIGAVLQNHHGTGSRWWKYGEDLYDQLHAGQEPPLVDPSGFDLWPHVSEHWRVMSLPESRPEPVHVVGTQVGDNLTTEEHFDAVPVGAVIANQHGSGSRWRKTEHRSFRSGAGEGGSNLDLWGYSGENWRVVEVPEASVTEAPDNAEVQRLREEVEALRRELEEARGELREEITVRVTAYGTAEIDDGIIDRNLPGSMTTPEPVEVRWDWSGTIPRTVDRGDCACDDIDDDALLAYFREQDWEVDSFEVSDITCSCDND